MTNSPGPSPFRPDADTGAAPTLLVFTSELLPHSQTFVRDHVANVRALDTVLLGIKRVPGLDIGDLATAVLPPSRRQRLLLWLFGVSPFLDRLVAERNVVAIHAHFADAGMRIARYARRRRLPLIVTLHGADVLRQRAGSGPAGWLQALMFREMLRSTTQFVAVSEYIRQAALWAGYPPHKLMRQALGIPLARNAAPPEREGRVSTPDILFVGRMVEKKGLAFLLEAARMLARKGAAFTLTIVGDGPLADEHRRQAVGLEGHVRFLGVRTPEQVRRHLEEADIFCMPSTQAADGDNEGLPIVCLEAQAAALPVVAFAQGPVLEGVVDGRTGLLAQDKSAEGLAEALGRLLTDAGLRVRLGRQGHAFVREHFDIRDRSKELDELYNRVTLTGS